MSLPFLFASSVASTERFELASPHLNSVEIPPPDRDMLLAMTALAEAAQGTVDDGIVRQWVNAALRAEATFACAIDNDDASTLGGLSFG